MKAQNISRKLLVMALSIGMLFTYSASFATYAAASDPVDTDVKLWSVEPVAAKTINVGANAMKINADGWNTADGQYLYYGAYDNAPVKYRVLDRHNGTSHTVFPDAAKTTTMSAPEGDYLLLDSDAILFNASFDADSNDYSKSDIHAYLNNSASLFSAKELLQIAGTTLAASTETYKSGDLSYKDYAIAAVPAKSFLLSTAEAAELYADNTARIKNGAWWLRSAGTNITTFAGFVDPTGILFTFVVASKFGVSPASNLDLSSVLFTSASNASKTTELKKGAGAVTASTGNTWAVTLKDDTKKVQTTGALKRNAKTQLVSVPYSYTGDNIDQISVVITDKAMTDADKTESVLYYGKLADASENKLGTATFTLPAGLPDGYKVYILAEDVNEDTTNGDKLTDYASAPVELTIPDGTYDITTSATAGGDSAKGPDTGDDSSSMTPWVLLGGSAAALIIVAARKRKLS